MTITPMKPLELDWERIATVRVTLEKPFRGGGLRFRLGTTDPKKNLNFNPHDKKSGPPWHPGLPIMFPEDAPAIPGDPKRDSFLMSASTTAMRPTRRGEMAPDPAAQAAFIAFGYFMAPLTDEDGLAGFTQSTERSRVAAFWNWFKMPPGDGTMHPPMNRIGPPDIPQVAIRPLDRNLAVLRDAEGEEIVIRPFQFWGFDDNTQYEVLPGQAPVASEDRALLEGLTREELEGLREFLRSRKHGAKA